MTRRRWFQPLALALLTLIPAMQARANAVRDANLLWPKSSAGKVVIPYVIDSSLGAGARTALQNAINQFAAKTCVRLVPRTTEANHLNVIPGQGCYSYIGNIRQGAQALSLGTGCEATGTAVHQFMHALGFYDEQTRPDRDVYVNVYLQNIQSGASSHFSICQDCTTQDIPYEYASIMHLGAKAYSANGQSTLAPRQTGVQLAEPHTKAGLTVLDVKKIHKRYQCP